MNLKEIADVLESSKENLNRHFTPLRASAFQEADFQPLDRDGLTHLARILRHLATHQLMIETACDELGYRLRTFSDNDAEIEEQPAIAYLHGKGALLGVARQQSSVISGVLTSLATDLNAFSKELNSEDTPS